MTFRCHDSCEIAVGSQFTGEETGTQRKWSSYRGSKPNQSDAFLHESHSPFFVDGNDSGQMLAVGR